MQVLSMFFAALCLQVSVALPDVELKNAAVPGLMMPAIGFGTGGYGMENEAYGVYPECWDEPHPTTAGPPPPGCGENVVTAVSLWLGLGGKRLDCANTYYNQASVGVALRRTEVPRSQLFILSKVGPTLPLGYNDTLQQFAATKKDLGVDYVDSLLIHWPGIHPGGTSVGTSTDPLCIPGGPEFNEKACRISTWKAMLQIFTEGGARSIGVSNYNSTHIQEIIDEGLPLPAINQCPFNPYHGRAQFETIDFCRKHNVTFMGYSPLGVPDVHKYPAGNGMSPSILNDPTVVRVANLHNISSATAILRWIWAHGVPTNPRSMRQAHMLENLAALDGELSKADIDDISALPQDLCSVDPDWYSCIPDTQ